MAHYYLNLKTFSRGDGSRVTRAAAYRSGERIRDERTSAVYDHTERTDVVHAEIVLPAAMTGRSDMAWARDRSSLWNAAEQSGRRRDARLAKEVLVNLPPELTPAQRIALVRGFSNDLADRYKGAVDFALHPPRPHADERHHHAHVLMTTREVGPDGLGARTRFELSGRERHARGLPSHKEELHWVRARWAEVTNEALRDAGLAVRVDHRSYAARGIDREPKPHIPREIRYAERQLGRSIAAGDAIRAQYRERVEARAKGPEELRRVEAAQRETRRQYAVQAAARRETERKIPYGALTREELNERRRDWYRRNAQEINAKRREHQRTREREAQPPVARDTTLAEASARTWAAYRERQMRHDAERGGSPAEEAARNWKAYRDRQLRLDAERGTTPAAEAARNWLAYREREKQRETSQSVSQGVRPDINKDRSTSRARDDHDVSL